MYFDLKKAKIYKAFVFEQIFFPRILHSFILVCLWLSGISFAIFLLSKGLTFTVFGISINFALSLNADMFQGMLFLILPIGLTALFFEIFYKFYLQYPTIKKGEENWAEYLDFSTFHVFQKAFSASRRMNENALSVNSIFFALATYNESAKFLRRLDLIQQDITEQFNIPIQSKKTHSARPRDFGEDVAQLFQSLDQFRAETQVSGKITIGQLVVALYETSEQFRKLLAKKDLQKEDLVTVSFWNESINFRSEKRRRFWTKENLLYKLPIGAGWIYGLPFLLEQYSRDITGQFFESKFEFYLQNREKEMQQLISALIRNEKQNAILVGEAGVGKKSIIKAFAKKIIQNEVPEALHEKRVLELNLSAVVSRLPNKAEARNFLSSVLNEAISIGNIILFIDGLHNFIGHQEGLGRIDASEIFLPYLESSSIQIITTSDPASFHRFIETRADILATFERIDIEELGRADTVAILNNKAAVFEKEQKLFFTYSAVKAIYEDARRFIYTTPFPGKALNLLNDAVIYAQNQRKQVVGPQDINIIVTTKTNVPLGEIGGEEREKLANLSSIMHREIIGQNIAINTVSSAMQRLRAGVSREGKPAGVFLFVGPTGVGKTLTAKVLADIYFGSQEKMIRFDMGEYQTEESVDRLIGSAVANEPGQLASQVRDNPFSVILLDEFEKAHKDLLNIFLRVFDEGKLTDALGRKVNFENNIIIATSNAGAEKIRKMIQAGEDPSQKKEELLELFIEKGYFKPELLNRFDEIVVYKTLNRGEVKKIAELLILKFVQRLKNKGYYLKPTSEIVNYIAEIGFDPEFGVRPMNRAIADTLETKIARLILENRIKKGEEFILNPK